MDMSQLAGLSKPTEDVGGKLENAVAQKDLGNKFFKDGDNKSAARHYHSALMFVNGMVGITPDQTKKANEIKVACYNNLAAVNLKEGKLNRVIDCSTKVIDIDNNNVKALFRRGKAFLTQGNLDRAEKDLQAAAKLDPKDAAITKELQVLKQKNKEADKKSQKFFANMFDKMSKDTSEDEPKKEVTTENN